MSISNSKFAVFDVETPNHENNRISSIGITLIENGQIVDTFHSYINPDTYFDDFNIELTGISPEDVYTAPDFCELWDEIQHYFDNSILVAHNATFDLRVLDSCLSAYGINWKPEVQYLCTYQLARKNLKFLPSKKLNSICNYLDIELDHHNALSDSIACAKILQYFISTNVDLSTNLKTFSLTFDESRISNFARFFGQSECPYCRNIYNKYYNHRCPVCDDIDFHNIAYVEIEKEVEVYHEEEHEEFDPVMTDFLTQVDGWQHYETETVTETVYDGLQYEFLITYKDGTSIRRKYMEDHPICQRLLSIYEQDDFTFEEQDNRIDDVIRELKSCTFEYLFPKSETIRILKENYGFTDEEIDNALEQIHIDWKEIALKKANELANEDHKYKDKSSFIDTMENIYEFPHDDAVFAVENCEYDWHSQAIAELKHNIIYFSINSRCDAINFLIKTYNFTEEDATKIADEIWESRINILFESVKDLVERKLLNRKESVIEYMVINYKISTEEATICAEKLFEDNTTR